jgi:hypothetical protein
VSSIRDVRAWGIASQEMFEKKTALRLVIVGGNSIGGSSIGGNSMGGKGVGGKGVGADGCSGSSTIGRARRCWDLLRGTRRTG